MNSKLRFISLVFGLSSLISFSACTDYQEEFDNNFGALEYADDSGEIPVIDSSPSGDILSSSDEDSNENDPVSSSVDDALSSANPASSGAEQSSSSKGKSSSSEKTKESSSSGKGSSSSSAKSSSSFVSSSSSSAQSSSSYEPPEGNYGKMEYRGQTYRTVVIGNQLWMAENMNADEDGSVCYKDSTKYCDMYGRLYSWDAAMKVCPEGWRLPDTTDWSILFKSVGGKETAATHLKATSSWDSNGDGNGDDKFGFSAFAAGGSDTGSDLKYAGKGNSAAFWTSEVKNSYDAWGVEMYWADSYPTIDEEPLASNRRSVRCMKDAIQDERDGQIYNIVKIGNQTWMAQNLNYKTDDSYCYGENNAQTTNKYCETYGRLYKIKKTLEMTGGVCPGGWHVPNVDEWQTLFDAVEGKNSAAIHLKSKSDWKEDDYDDNVDSRGIDDYGFSALPGGQRVAGAFTGRGENAWLLSTTASKTSGCSGCKYIINFVYSLPDAAFSDGVEENAVSVRCIKDAE